MREREQHNLAMTAAETMYNLWELEGQQTEPDLDAMMKRLKDLSAYSLTHAEILNRREGIELLALAMFFGISSNPQYRNNQERLQQLSEETHAYQGRPELFEQEVKQRTESKRQPGLEDDDGAQLRLL